MGTKNDQGSITEFNTTGSHSSITIKQSKFYDRGSTACNGSSQEGGVYVSAEMEWSGKPSEKG